MNNNNNFSNIIYNHHLLLILILIHTPISPIDHTKYNFSHTNKQMPGYVLSPLCTSIPASMTHAQSSMHKPHSFTHRRPFTLRRIRSQPAFAQDPSQRTPADKNKARVTRRPNHIVQARFYWRKLGLGARARSQSDEIDSAEKKFFGLQINTENPLGS